MPELERSAPLEVRAAGRTLIGEAVRYGQRATDRPERFEAGAFAPVGAVNLNLQHDPAIVLAATGDRLQLTDTDRALEVRAQLRPGAALTLLQRGSLRGLSVEFRSLAERQQDGVRVIERAHLEGIGLVDTPSYAGRLELRALSGRTVAATIPTGANLACDCAGDPQERFARLMSEGVAEVIEAAMAEVEKGILAAWQSYENPLASTARGTLRLARADDGLGVEIDLPDSPAGRAVLDAHDAAGIVVRPHIDRRAATWTTEPVEGGDTVAVYSSWPVRAIIVSSTDRRQGWPTPTLRATEAVEERRHRRKVWL